MKRIGLIGGMSWESSAQYYAIINRAVRDRLGPPHSADLLMRSVDFAQIEAFQHDGDWPALGRLMVEAGRALEAGGADCLVLCTNTMHKLAPAIEAECRLPLLHIADAAATAMKAHGLSRVGLLGTAFTMEQDFYRGRLAQRHGLEVLTPDAGQRAEIHRIIYDELVNGEIRDQSRETYRAAMQALAARGAQGIVLGCTEIMLLVGERDSPVPLFDTTTLHALAAVDFALGPAIGPER